MAFKAFLPLLLVAAAGSLMPVHIVSAEPPPWAPAHGHRAKHQYIYYPVAEIYYEPTREIWYWLEGEHWREANVLPVHYRQYTRDGITVHLDSERPYDQHQHVVQQYGRGVSAAPRQGPQGRASQGHDGKGSGAHGEGRGKGHAGDRPGKGQHPGKGKDKDKHGRGDGHGHDGRGD